ncbi:hypothetical protein Tsp_14574, partial [Trichinella spiralis]|uniref:hypothetical protein n=1 Tax=Trichinella spiralis TaxID=6334 RepID=UPI0001EFD27D
ITSSPELLWSFICFGHRDKSCSDHFVLNGHPLLRYPMKLVPLATLVHMDVKAFPSRPSVPLLITNSINRNHADKYVITKHCHQLMPLVNSVKYKSKSKKTRKQTM